jgi:hypothetical protein
MSGVSGWFERVARLAALAERVSSLSKGVESLAHKVEDHQDRPRPCGTGHAVK